MGWRGPKVVPFDEIDMSGRAKWTATAEPDRVAHFVRTVQGGGELKPSVFVQTPDGVHHVADGHHRVLADEQLGRDPIGFVLDVPTKEGPWMDMHNAQKGGLSRIESSSGGSVPPPPPAPQVDEDALPPLAPHEQAWVDKDPKNADRDDNPPSFIDDEDTWERAKEAVMPHWDEYDEPYAVVMHVYKLMGGGTSGDD